MKAVMGSLDRDTVAKVEVWVEAVVAADSHFIA
jgi:hypothetical protein